MDVFLIVVNQQDFLWRCAIDKDEVFCFSSPGDVLDVSKPIWGVTFCGKKISYASESLFVDGSEDHDSRKKLPAIFQKVEKPWPGDLAYGI